MESARDYGQAPAVETKTLRPSLGETPRLIHPKCAPVGSVNENHVATPPSTLSSAIWPGAKVKVNVAESQ